MNEGRHFRGTEGRRLTVAAAIDRYLAEEKPKKGDGHSGRLIWWKEQIGHLKLRDVTAAIVTEHRGHLGGETYTQAKTVSKWSVVKGEEASQFKCAPGTPSRDQCTGENYVCQWYLMSVGRRLQNMTDGARFTPYSPGMLTMTVAVR